MPPPARFLQSNTATVAAIKTTDATTRDSDVVVILAALLCALICVIGLALLARCAWLRRSLSSSRRAPQPPLTPTKGLKKKALRSLPTTSFDAAAAAAGDRLAECPICLAEFVQGDGIRILPDCGHGFHVNCVDTWLVSHSSCPSCRRILIVDPPNKCRLCGADPAAGGASLSEAGFKAREDGHARMFLP